MEQEIEEKLIEIIQQAGGMFLQRHLTTIVSKEGHANFVTNIDSAVEEYLERELLRLVPGSRFIGEEKENQELTDDPTWIVDPVDGTTNMIHDYRMSAISVALCEGKEPVIGIVYQPYTKELFSAEKGKGAFLNGEPIHVAATPFAEALIAIGTAPYYEELQEQSMRTAQDYLRSCADIRRSGSAAIDLAYLACGRHDAFLEMRLKPWDYAAGSLLVQEAGGLVQMPLIGKMDYRQSTAILAATPACMEPAAAVFWRNNR